MEKETFFGELAQIVSIAAEANRLMKIMFKIGYQNEALTNKMREMRDLEKKSDEIAFKLGEDITAGAVSPNIIDDLIESVQAADDHRRSVLLSKQRTNPHV